MMRSSSVVSKKMSTALLALKPLPETEVLMVGGPKVVDNEIA